MPKKEIICTCQCDKCKKRRLWAYRSFLLHKWAMSLPKGENTGRIFNLNFRNILRWFVFKHFLGLAAGYWYKEAIKEGEREDVSRRFAKTKVS